MGFDPMTRFKDFVRAVVLSESSGMSGKRLSEGSMAWGDERLLKSVASAVKDRCQREGERLGGEGAGQPADQVLRHADI